MDAREDFTGVLEGFWAVPKEFRRGSSFKVRGVKGVLMGFRSSSERYYRISGSFRTVGLHELSRAFR